MFFAILHPEELFRFVAFVLRAVLRGYEISWLKVWLLLVYTDPVSPLLDWEIHLFAGGQIRSSPPRLLLRGSDGVGARTLGQAKTICGKPDGVGVNEVGSMQFMR